MQNELTIPQCLNFLATHSDVRVNHDGSDVAPWITYQEGRRAYELRNSGTSFACSITRYARERDPDWIPPAEDAEPQSVRHDEKWALMYVEERRLVLGYEGRFWDVHRWGETPSEVSDTSPVEVLEAWQAKYAPDKPKPTREETAMKLLREAYGHLLYPIVDASLTNKIQGFLNKAAEGATDAGGSNHVD